MARAARPPFRELERRARGRRPRLGDPAAGPADPRRPLGARGAGNLRRRAAGHGLRPGARDLARAARRGGLRERVDRGAARRLRRGHGGRAADGAGRRAAPPRCGADHRPRGGDPARSVHLGWTLRQPCLAAGAAQALHQAHLGQRRRGQPATRGGAAPQERGHGRHLGRRAAGAGGGLGAARPGRAHADPLPRLWPDAARTGRRRHRLRRLSAAHDRRALDAPRRRASGGGSAWRARQHPGPGSACRASRPRPADHGGGAARRPAGRGREAAAVALPGVAPGRLRLGHGDRPRRLHRLQCLRGRVRRREQHPRGRQGAGRHGPRDALAEGRPLLFGAGRQPCDSLAAAALHALREGALRGRLPGQRDGARARRPQPDDLQPLRRHPHLRELLPLQGAALQLPRLQRAGGAGPLAVAQSGRHRAGARGDGEVHLLRPADQRGADRGQEGGPPDRRRRGGDRVPAGLPDPGDHLRRPQRSRKRGRQGQAQPAQLRAARRAQHAAPHLVSRRGQGARARAGTAEGA